MSVHITADQKVEDILTRFPQTIGTFVEFGFKPLRHPLLRRTFAPLITVRGAAKLHHWPDSRLEAFLAQLNDQASREAPPCSEEQEEAPLYDLADVEGLRGQNILVSPEVVEIDNRGLEPPEPMLRILSVAQQLAPGQRLEALNQRRPMLLYPKLDELGLEHRTDELSDGLFRITVTRGR